MIRYHVDVSPLIFGRTAIKSGYERPGVDDAPGELKTKTAAVIPEGVAGDDVVSQLPDMVRSIARKICARDVCIVKSGLESVGQTTELWASCTGQCLTSGGNIPEQAIIETGLRLAANADLSIE